MTRCVVWVLVAMVLAGPAAAQSVSGSFAGSVAAGAVTAEVMPLSLRGALDRGLRYNLGVITLEEQVASARGTRLRLLRELMPRLDARVDDATQTRNLAAFGFDASAIPGVAFPSVVGPFNVFDARLYASQTVYDATTRHDIRSSAFALTAAQHESQNAHDVVTFVVTSLYFQAVAGVRRIDTARAQVATADSLLQLATSQRNAGVTPGIDVVRAQVQLQAQRQRLIAAENDYAKLTLQLARTIGLPVAQRVELTDGDVEVPVPAVSLDEALRRAAASRADHLAAVERVHAAEASLKAVQTETRPTVHLNADVGTIGTNPANVRGTYAVGGSLRLSVFDASRTGREAESAARLRQRQAEAADIVQRIEAEVRTAFLDVQASEQQLAVARERVALARQELSLAQIRFTAGVTGNLEVIQAQTALSAATDTEIAGVYAFNVAKAALVRALGDTGARP